MLGETDRDLFACLSVFVGGAGLDAIEQVCANDAVVAPLDALDSLVEKSLVRQAEGVDGEPRFAMLETIREFAIEQAVAAGRWDGLRERHAMLFTALAEESAEQVMGSSKRAVLDRLAEEHDNMRAAIGWALETDAAETALRLGAALWRFWQMRGYLPEGRAQLDRVLALEHGREHPLNRAAALDAAAGVAYWLADAESSRALYTEEIELRRELGDRRALADTLYSISFTWSIIGDEKDRKADAARSYVTEALEIYRELGDDSGIGRCEWALANIAYGTGDTEEAFDHGRRSLEVFERIDDRFMIGWASYTLGLGHVTRVRDGIGTPDDLVDARRRFREALEIFAEAQDVSGYTLVLDGFAVLAYREGDLERAARLSGAVAHLERTSGTGLNLWNREVLGFDPDGLRADNAAAWAEGEAMTTEEAVAYALSG